MRPALTILLMLFSCFAYTQKLPPAAVANAYMLTEADGFPGSNYTHWQYAPSGKVYARDFFGNLHVTGNNFIKYIPGLKSLTNTTEIILRPDNEVWLYDGSSNIHIIKNDSLWETVAYKGNNSTGIWGYGVTRVFILQLTGKVLVLYEFKNYAWEVINKTTQPSDIKPESITNCYYNGKIVIIVSAPGNQQKIYEMDIPISRRPPGLCAPVTYFTAGGRYSCTATNA